MSTITPALTPGRILLSLVSLTTSLGPYLADWNATHVLNPNWPPHARFHNGMTMSTGLCLGILTAYFAWRPTWRSQHSEGMTEKESITIAAVMGSLYWVAAMSAIFYPGARWVDPEFGEGAPQLPIFLGAPGVAVLGWGLEMGRLNSLKEKGKGM
jgi:hypothetical protein